MASDQKVEYSIWQISTKLSYNTAKLLPTKSNARGCIQWFSKMRGCLRFVKFSNNRLKIFAIFFLIFVIILRQFLITA